jgi:hypothetical protein
MTQMRVGYEKMTVSLEALNGNSDAHQGDMRAQLNFLASRIDAKQEEMKEMLDACLEKWRKIQENRSP